MYDTRLKFGCVRALSEEIYQSMGALICLKMHTLFCSIKLQCCYLKPENIREFFLATRAPLYSAHSSRKRVKQGKKRKKSRFLDFQKNVKKRNSNNMYCRPKFLGLNTMLVKFVVHYATTKAIYIINIQVLEL